MGILKSLFTLGKSFISQAEESIEETQWRAHAGTAYS